MKKIMHYILSYLGAFLLFSGLIGTLLKWFSIYVCPEYYNAIGKIIIAFIAFLFGLIITFRFYKPLKYQ